MKCLNCRMSLMATDTCCPSCGRPTPLQRAAAVSREALLEARAAVDPDAWSEYSRELTVRAVVIMLIGLGFVVGGAWFFYDARSVPTQASHVTEDDLLRANSAAALPDWITFNPSKCINTGVEIVKLRTQKTTSKFILIAVKDRWLVAQVAPDYNGRGVEGKLVGLDNSAISKMVPNFPKETRSLLPFQLDARAGVAGSQRSSYILGGFGVVLGTLAFFSGMRGLMDRPPSFRGSVSPPTKTPVAGSLQLASGRLLSATAPALAPAISDPQPAAQPEKAPRKRGWFRRALVTLVWAAFLFIAAVVITSLVSVLRAGNDPELGKKLAQEAGRSLGPWLLLGSVGLTATLRCLGWLPGTRR